MSQISQGDILDGLIGVTKPTIDRILKLDCAADALALYLFYCYTAKWQKTLIIKATKEYCIEGLKIGEIRFQKAKNALRELKLIDDIVRRDDKGKTTGWFVEVSFVNLSTTSVSTGVENPPSGKTTPKCLSTNKLNALNTSTTCSSDDFAFENESEEKPVIIGNDKKSFPSKAKKPEDAPTPEEVMRLWHTQYVLPKISEMTAGRVSRIKALGKTKFFRDNWREGIMKIHKIPWMMGKTNPKYPRPITIDHFLQYDWLAKIMEYETSDSPSDAASTSNLTDRSKYTEEQFQKFFDAEFSHSPDKWTLHTCPEPQFKEFTKYADDYK